MGRSDLVDEEILMRFREVGLKAVKYGVESGVQELVDNAEKNLNLKVATRNMILTRKLGIKMHLTFTLGLPGETWDTVKRSVGYAMFIDPDSVQFSIMTPFPGTRFHKSMKDNDMIMSSNYADYDGNTSSVIKTASMSNEELTKAQHYAYSRWHDFKFKKHKYANSPLRLFMDCLRENGLAYTLRHTFSYIQKKNYRWYKR
jgi:radical SAM superfamily enzyme YgiQ (UPF0313 family)